MNLATRYIQKFKKYQEHPLYRTLEESDQELIRELCVRFLFTYQEFNQLVTLCKDLFLWQSEGLQQWLKKQTPLKKLSGAQDKKRFLDALKEYSSMLCAQPTPYSSQPSWTPSLPRKKFKTIDSEKKIFGQCPVYSEKTLCCNLYTIDAATNCSFGCSYCSIQTFYTEDVAFDAGFKVKLEALQIDEDRFYHIGTGQASDSLAYGNRNGILDSLSQFATRHPQVLLELKTKSRNIQYFLDHPPPPNLVCSWSLNTPDVITHEEHFTASLNERLHAARLVADKGIKVAFHFHPMVYTDNFEADYPAIADQIMKMFDPDEILFMTAGSVTLIKPVLKKIRHMNHPTKISQMTMDQDPHGKFTYPDKIKIKLFRTLWQALNPWHQKVFFYLCMEKPNIWQQSLGFIFPDNQSFEAAFAKAAFEKINKSVTSTQTESSLRVIS